MQMEIADIREKREAAGISQEVLAGEAGISRRYLIDIESGKKEPSEQVLGRIETVLQRHLQGGGLRILTDYVRIRFPTTDAENVIENVLGIQAKYMVLQGHALYSYSWQFVLGDITVMFSDDEKLGTLMELHGKGCRQFEAYLDAQNRTWPVFFEMARGYGGIAKRIDIAVDDVTGMLDIPELAEKCERGETTSLFRSWRKYQSGMLIRAHEEDREHMGCTLYMGTMKSDIYFCIYEKNYEQYVKSGVLPEEAETKNRFEIRLKNDRAERMLDHLLENGGEDVGEMAFAVISHYVRFLQPDTGKAKRDWKPDAAWERFTGACRREIRLTVKPEPYTLERSLNWISRQVAPTLKMVKRLDGMLGREDRIEQVIRDARLDKKHEQIIRQQMLSAEEAVNEKCRFRERAGA